MMKRIAALTFLISSFCMSHATAAAEQRPNIVYFLVDDLGYADCGFNGGKDIRTPNIDKLAKSGAVLKSFTFNRSARPRDQR